MEEKRSGACMIENPKKVLIMRLGAIGDVVQTSEVFRSIKRAYKECEIHYLTGTIPANLYSRDEDLAKVFTLDKLSFKNIFTIAKKLRAEKYDVAICLKSSLKMYLLAWLSGAKNILSYTSDSEKHLVYNYFQTIEGKISSVEFKNELSLKIPEDVKNGVKPAIPTDKKFVILATQAGQPKEGRKWRIEKYKELACKLTEKYDVAVILTGTAEERERLEAFDGMENVYDLAGRFNILESAALCSFAEYVVGADTGILHIASALEKPICIGLYGAMSIQRSGVLGDKNHSLTSHKLGCIPCGKNFCKLRNGEFTPCMDDIDADDIMSIIEEDGILPLNQK